MLLAETVFSPYIKTGLRWLETGSVAFLFSLLSDEQFQPLCNARHHETTNAVRAGLLDNGLGLFHHNSNVRVPKSFVKQLITW